MRHGQVGTRWRSRAVRPRQCIFGGSLTQQTEKEHDGVFCSFSDLMKLGAGERAGGTVSTLIEDMKQIHNVFHIGFDEIFKLLIGSSPLHEESNEFWRAGWVSPAV